MRWGVLDCRGGCSVLFVLGWTEAFMQRSAVCTGTSTLTSASYPVVGYSLSLGDFYRGRLNTPPPGTSRPTSCAEVHVKYSIHRYPRLASHQSHLPSKDRPSPTPFPPLLVPSLSSPCPLPVPSLVPQPPAHQSPPSSTSTLSTKVVPHHSTIHIRRSAASKRHKPTHNPPSPVFSFPVRTPRAC